MRIVGEIPHPVLKITIFLHDSKYAIKFESGLYELTYKFRTGEELDTVEDIKRIVDEDFILHVMEMLPKMHFMKLEAIKRHVSKNNEASEFELII